MSGDGLGDLRTDDVSASERSVEGCCAVLLGQEAVPLLEESSSVCEAIGDRPVLELMVTSPLGIVPRELEDLWPAGHYDVPVTGDWSADELNRIHDLVSDLTTRLGFQSVIDHCDLGLDGRLPNGVLIETRQGQSAGSREALQRLREAVGAACRQDPLPRLRGPGPRLEAFRSISRRLLGSDVWMDGVETAGRPPRRFMHHGTQLAMWDPSFSVLLLQSGRVALGQTWREPSRGAPGGGLYLVSQPPWWHGPERRPARSNGR